MSAEKETQRKREKTALAKHLCEVIDANEAGPLKARDKKIARDREELAAKIENLRKKQEKEKRELAEKKRKEEKVTRELFAEEKRLQELADLAEASTSGTPSSRRQASSDEVPPPRRHVEEEEEESEEEEMEEDFVTEEEEKEEEEPKSKGKGQKKKTATSQRRVRRPVFRPSRRDDEISRILEQAEDQAREMGLSQHQAAQLFETLTSKLVTPVADPRPKKPKKGRRNRYSSDED